MTLEADMSLSSDRTRTVGAPEDTYYSRNESHSSDSMDADCDYTLTGTGSLDYNNGKYSYTGSGEQTFQGSSHSESTVWGKRVTTRTYTGPWGTTRSNNVLYYNCDVSVPESLDAALQFGGASAESPQDGTGYKSETTFEITQDYEFDISNEGVTITGTQESTHQTSVPLDTSHDVGVRVTQTPKRYRWSAFDNTTTSTATSHITGSSQYEVRGGSAELTGAYSKERHKETDFDGRTLGEYDYRRGPATNYRHVHDHFDTTSTSHTTADLSENIEKYTYIDGDKTAKTHNVVQLHWREFDDGTASPRITDTYDIETVFKEYLKHTGEKSFDQDSSKLIDFDKDEWSRNTDTAKIEGSFEPESSTDPYARTGTHTTDETHMTRQSLVTNGDEDKGHEKSKDKETVKYERHETGVGYLPESMELDYTQDTTRDFKKTHEGQHDYSDNATIGAVTAGAGPCMSAAARAISASGKLGSYAVKGVQLTGRAWGLKTGIEASVAAIDHLASGDYTALFFDVLNAGIGFGTAKFAKGQCFVTDTLVWVPPQTCTLAYAAGRTRSWPRPHKNVGRSLICPSVHLGRNRPTQDASLSARPPWQFG